MGGICGRTGAISAMIWGLVKYFRRHFGSSATFSLRVMPLTKNRFVTTCPGVEAKSSRREINAGTDTKADNPARGMHRATAFLCQNWQLPRRETKPSACVRMSFWLRMRISSAPRNWPFWRDPALREIFFMKRPPRERARDRSRTNLTSSGSSPCPNNHFPPFAPAAVVTGDLALFCESPQLPVLPKPPEPRTVPSNS